jgi:plasmid stabilization system protein ParE
LAQLSLRVSSQGKVLLWRLQAYYSEFGGDARVWQLNQVVEELLDRLCAFPRAYPIWKRDIRRIIASQFYLEIYYRVRSDHIEILAFTDQRQDPRRLRFITPR